MSSHGENRHTPPAISTSLSTSLTHLENGIIIGMSWVGFPRADDVLASQSGMISAERFLAILQEKDLLPADLIERLRKQIERMQPPPTSASLSKQLIEEGYLTPALVKRLMAQGAFTPLLHERLTAAGEAPVAAAGQPPQAVPEAAGAKPVAAEAEGVAAPPPAAGGDKAAEFPGQPAATPAPASGGEAKKPEEELGFAPLDEELSAAPGGGGKAESQPAPSPETPPAASPAPPAASPSLLEEELAPLGGGAKPLEQLSNGPAAGAFADGISLGPARPRKHRWRRAVKNAFRRVFQPPKKVVRVKKLDRKQFTMTVVAWGIAVVLVIAGLICATLWLPRSPEEMWQKAQAAYQNGDYAVAAEQFAAFAKRSPNDSRASQARVMAALARIRRAAKKDGPSKAVKAAQAVLPKIRGEDAYRDAESELGLLLTEIAADLSKQIQQHPEQSLGQDARAALALVERFVPEESQPKERMAEVAASLTINEREVGRASALDAAINEIGDAVRKGELARVFARYDALVNDYPELIGNERLVEAVEEAEAAERELVKAAPFQEKAAQALSPSAAAACTALVSQSKTGDARGAKGQVATVVAGGAAYGVDAASGKVLWRRPIGLANRQVATFPPQHVSAEPGSDVLIVDAVRWELQRLAAASGRVVWRRRLGEPLAGPPTITGKLAVAAATSGRMTAIDLGDGKAVLCLQFPQPLATAPAYDAKRSLLLQPADRANLYAISLPDGRCRQVVHLGHRAGAIAVPPVVVGDGVLAAENRGGGFVLLALSFAGAKQGQAETLRLVQQVPLKGRVISPIAADERRAVIAAAAGMLYVYDLGGQAAAPLRKIAESDLAGAESYRFAVLRGDRFWLADTQLAEYEIHADEGSLALTWIAEQDSIFQQPPLIFGETICDVRRPANLPGVVVSALDRAGQEAIWQVEVAAPLADELLCDAAEKRLTAVTALGALFQIDVAKFRGAEILDRPTLAIPAGKLVRPVRCVVPLGEGRFVMTFGGDSNQIIAFDPQEEEKRFRWLITPRSAMSCADRVGRRAVDALQERRNLLPRHAQHGEPRRAVRAGFSGRLEVASARCRRPEGSRRLRRQQAGLSLPHRARRRRQARPKSRSPTRRCWTDRSPRRWRQSRKRFTSLTTPACSMPSSCRRWPRARPTSSAAPAPGGRGAPGSAFSWPRTKASCFASTAGGSRVGKSRCRTARWRERRGTPADNSSSPPPAASSAAWTPPAARNWARRTPASPSAAARSRSPAGSLSPPTTAASANCRRFEARSPPQAAH